MEVRKTVFLKAFVITLAIFLSVYSLNLYMNMERERVLKEQMDEVVDEFEEFQALNALMEVYGENATCVTLTSRIKLLDSKIWALGQRIETYREVSRDYLKDPYYQLQKQKFNRQEVTYLAVLKGLKERCGLDQTLVLFFYRKGEYCDTCDEQSYVLDYFNQRIDSEIAVFSFDTDLGLPSVEVLRAIYNVTEYPSVVVEDNVHAGLKNKEEIQAILCESTNNTLSIC